MSDCLFCRIVAGELPAKVLYQDDDVMAFHDINPQAPLHALIIPRKHIATLAELPEEDTELAGKLFQVAKKIAAEQGYAESGYRVIMNCGKHGGQVVYHIHLHLLAGKQLHGL